MVNVTLSDRITSFCNYGSVSFGYRYLRFLVNEGEDLEILGRVLVLLHDSVFHTNYVLY
jgi:hypothetical protein